MLRGVCYKNDSKNNYYRNMRNSVQKHRKYFKIIEKLFFSLKNERSIKAQEVDRTQNRQNQKRNTSLLITIKHKMYR